MFDILFCSLIVGMIIVILFNESCPILYLVLPPLQEVISFLTRVDWSNSFKKKGLYSPSFFPLITNPP